MVTLDSSDNSSQWHNPARWKILIRSIALVVAVPCIISKSATILRSTAEQQDDPMTLHRLLQQVGNAVTGEHRIFSPTGEDRSSDGSISDRGDSSLLSVQDHMDSQLENSKKPFEGSSPMDANLPYEPPPSDTGADSDPGGAAADNASDNADDNNDNGNMGSATRDPNNPHQNITFKIGLINKIENGLLLSEGLKSHVIAESGRKVRYYNQEQSSSVFHDWPDGGDVFVDTRPENPGGWVLISNSEEDREGQGGVGAITFDASGNVIDYRMVLTGTTMNCNGGKTSFGAWISCEEDFWSANGKVWQVDPLGIRAPQIITLGSEGGIFEAFAEDIRDPAKPHFFLTEDDEYGPMQRFTPDAPDWNKPWEILLGPGTVDYLVLLPNQNDHTQGIYTWIENKRQAKQNAAYYYPNAEGLSVHENSLFVVCKKYNHLYELDLDRLTYTRKSTSSGLFDGTPDQLRKIIGPPAGEAANTDGSEEEPEVLLYFTEDGGEKAGIHARNAKGEVFTVLEGMYTPETTGLSFSPDGTRMYFAYQEDGMMFEVQRIDGHPFYGKTLNLKNHQFEGSTESPTERRKRRDKIRRARYNR
ncbi:osmC-like protein [Seminavis robusta]|uniref:OsmC-like protein n=1 Tax=Seminavis robusta TaxID=568900 RepID=A0A9N8HAH4_9STRA|nr:osmC-like protein [Seminavis robusta]|eukprot:Sro296_g110690.1 osmC-like protein (587) ;mRNA; r:39282-41398